MKILFLSRATLFSVKGGDTIQMENTASALRKMGVDVVIELCNNDHIDYSGYDLIHFFNIIRPADIMYHIDKSKLPFVVSPIYVEYDKQGNSDVKSWSAKLIGFLGKNGQEYVKCIARAIKNGEKIMSFRYIVTGHKRSVIYVLKRCQHLLPNSESEYNRLHRDFPNAGIHSVVYNAIDTGIFKATEAELKMDRGSTVLCVARFEPRKNQLNTIKALSGKDCKVCFVGDVAPNHQSYYQQCKAVAGSNISFLEFMDQESVAALYRQYKVHILPSWFETTGLSSLEAAACGCNIVISKNGDTASYFKDMAFYCDPGSPDSIVAAVDKALIAPVNLALLFEINERYHWAETARTTLEVYQKVLNA